jgi:hypothetical protein
MSDQTSLSLLTPVGYLQPTAPGTRVPGATILSAHRITKKINLPSGHEGPASASRPSMHLSCTDPFCPCSPQAPSLCQQLNQIVNSTLENTPAALHWQVIAYLAENQTVISKS